MTAYTAIITPNKDANLNDVTDLINANGNAIP